MRYEASQAFHHFLPGKFSHELRPIIHQQRYHDQPGCSCNPASRRHHGSAGRVRNPISRHIFTSLHLLTRRHFHAASNFFAIHSHVHAARCQQRPRDRSTARAN